MTWLSYLRTNGTRVFRELTQKLPSRSPLRHLGEGPIDTMAGFILNADGSEHVEIVRLLAGYGHPPTLALLREVASAKGNPNYPDRQDDADMAMAILAEVTTPKAIAAAVVNDNAPQPVAPVQPQIVYVDRPVPRPNPPQWSMRYQPSMGTAAQATSSARHTTR